MENIVFLLLALGLIAIGTTIVLIRAREPKGEFAVKSFQKEMKALAPDGRNLTPAEGTIRPPGIDPLLAGTIPSTSLTPAPAPTDEVDPRPAERQE
jgi:hypothetical protein